MSHNEAGKKWPSALYIRPGVLSKFGLWLSNGTSMDDFLRYTSIPDSEKVQLFNLYVAENESKAKIRLDEKQHAEAEQALLRPEGDRVYEVIGTERLTTDDRVRMWKHVNRANHSRPPSPSPSPPNSSVGCQGSSKNPQSRTTRSQEKLTPNGRLGTSGVGLFGTSGDGLNKRLGMGTRTKGEAPAPL